VNDPVRPWPAHWIRKPVAGIRIFCFPYAGGASRTYMSWSHAAGPAVEICPVMLPGHEARMAEPLATSMDALVAQLALELLPFLDAPYALVGHSMGGLMAFGLTERFAALGHPPQVLVVSGCVPRRDPGDLPLHTLGDADLLAELRTMNGTPPEFFDSPELVALLLPVVRSDFGLSETYDLAAGRVVDVPIAALAGSDDASVPPDSVRAWRQHTTRTFHLSVVPGDHFFIRDTARVLPLILSALPPSFV
jgi:medium-chain acyl-[acyl-carrier-protein] hydrolase